MSKKVKVTMEQAQEIDKISDVDYAINIHGLNKRPDSPLTTLKTADIARALFVGYEVEPEFKVGDWVVLEDGYIGEIEFINEVEEWANIGDSKDTKERGVYLAKTYDLVDIVRHATPSEIAAEKERRFWKKHNRNVWKLKEGDILINNGNKFAYEIIEVHSNGNVAFQYDTDYRDKELIRKNYKVVCFAEDRLDVKTNE